MESAIRIINTAIESSSDSISEKEECLVRGFGSAVDSAVRSSTAPNSEVSSVHGFGRAVENGIKSSTSSNLEAPESADSFGWTVENATRSRVAPNPPPLYGYSSTVDHAISSDVGVEAETEESPSGTFYEGFTDARRGKEQPTLRVFSLEELKSATKNFKHGNILGEGGFGSVYWGQLSDGSQIAVKRLNVRSNITETFTVELEILARVRHKNLLSLRGYCAEGQERLIVYEYMQNLCLHSSLHGHSLKCPLDWNHRMNIAIGSAEGIAYLHHQATPHIIHRDIKSSNVLLDSDFRPRVADFGFAKLIPDGATHVTTKVMGTRGYLAPEYAMLGQAKASCDVYSFGVLLLELVSGRGPIKMLSFAVRRSIVDWALPLVCEKKFSEIADPRLNGNYVEEELKRVVLIALISAQDLPEKRPTMLDVVELLKGESKDKFSHIENSEMFRKTLAADGTSVAEDSLDYISEEKKLERPLRKNASCFFCSCCNFQVNTRSRFLDWLGYVCFMCN